LVPELFGQEFRSVAIFRTWLPPLWTYLVEYSLDVPA